MNKLINLNKFTQKVKNWQWTNNIIRRNPLHYHWAKKWLSQMREASDSQRLALQNESLQCALQTASRTVYGQSVKDLFKFDSWPYLTKNTVRDRTADFLVPSVFPAVPASTGGTTGIPLKLRRSYRSIALEQAAIDLLLEIRGVQPASSKIAVLRGNNTIKADQTVPPFWKKEGGRLVLSSNHLNRNTIGFYLDELAQFKPDCLLAYPSVLEALCQFTEETGYRLSVPVVLTSSEVLMDHVRELAEEILGTRVVDIYGQAERVAFAYSLQSGEYFFLPGYSYVELEFIQQTGKYDLYEIIGTSYWNTAMPLVRYRTGDSIFVASGSGRDELESIKLGLKPFAGIAGRSGDYLISPEGSRLVGIDHIPRDVNNVIQMQIIQESANRVTILVIPGQHFSTADRTMILQNAHSKIPTSMKIDVVLTDMLEKTANGKTPYVLKRFNV